MKDPNVLIPIMVAAVIISGGAVVGLSYQHYESTQNVLSENTEIETVGGERPDYNPETISFLIHQKVNDHRLANNQTMLSYDPNIAVIATSHAQDMIDRDYFSHYSPEGKDASQRGIENGYEICGDVTPTQVEIDYKEKLAQFKTEQDQNNQQIRNLNQKINQYNAKLNELNHAGNTRDDIRDFTPNQDLTLERQLNEELSKLQIESSRLEAKSTNLNQDYSELQGLYQDSLEATQNTMQFAGLSENIRGGYVYRSFTIIGPVTTYEWSTNEGLAQETVQGWIDSPGHNENMLTPMFTKEGIGVSINSETNEIRVVQNFC